MAGDQTDGAAPDRGFQPTRLPSSLPPAHLAAVASIAAMVLLLYGSVLDAEFAFDDLPNIVENTSIRSGSLSLEEIRSIALHSPNLRPLANLSFAFNYALGGDDVRGYRAVNLLIHACNGVLVYALGLALYRRLARRSGSSATWKDARLVRWMALLAALLFVAHPLQTQSVTYVVQRMNSGATGFYLLAFWLYVLGRDAIASPRRAVFWSGTAVCWALAMGFKQIAITLPFSLWLYEWIFEQGADSRWARRTAIVPLGGLAALAVLLAVYSNGFAGYQGRPFSMAERVLTQPRVVADYLGLLALPLPGRLNLLHTVEPSRSLLTPPATLVWLLFHVAAVVLAFACAHRLRMASFAVLWFYLHMALESSPLPLELMYEHRTYLPSVAFAWLVPYALFSLLPSRPIVASSICVVGVLGLGVGTLARNEVWRNELSLWSDVVMKSPASPRAHNNVGLAYANRGRYEEAIPHYQEAIRLGPAGYGDPRSNLGFALSALEQLEEAVFWYREAVRAQPTHAHAHCHLGIALERMGAYEQAERHLQIALTLVPSYALARERLTELHERGRPDPRELP